MAFHSPTDQSSPPSIWGCSGIMHLSWSINRLVKKYSSITICQKVDDASSSRISPTTTHHSQPMHRPFAVIRNNPFFKILLILVKKLTIDISWSWRIYIWTSNLYRWNGRAIIWIICCVRWDVTEVKPRSNSSSHIFLLIFSQHSINPLLLGISARKCMWIQIMDSGSC